MQIPDLRSETQTDSQILHPGTRALYRYWESIRAERAAPNHQDLILKQIADHVPDLFIMDRDVAHNTYKWRLAGTRMCQLYGREMTGCDVLKGWDNFEHRIIRDMLDNVTYALQPCLLKVRLSTACGQIIGAEMIALPLRARYNDMMQVLGGIFPFRSISEMTCDKVISQELASARTIWTEHLPGDQLVASLKPENNRPFRVITGGRA